MDRQEVGEFPGGSSIDTAGTTSRSVRMGGEIQGVDGGSSRPGTREGIRLQGFCPYTPQSRRETFGIEGAEEFAPRGNGGVTSDRAKLEAYLVCPFPPR